MVLNYFQFCPVFVGMLAKDLADQWTLVLDLWNLNKTVKLLQKQFSRACQPYSKADDWK